MIVIIGQDPYHNGMATGLTFATPIGKMSLIWGILKRSTTVTT